MLLKIASSEVSQVGGGTSVAGHGPDQAVDGNWATGWAPRPLASNTGNWLRVDLAYSAWYTPGTDVIWSVKIIPHRHLVSSTLPATTTGRYFVYTYDASGGRALRCDRANVNWAQAQSDTCWSAASNGNQPLRNAAVIDFGLPSSNPTDANFLYGIAEVVIEVNQRPSSVPLPVRALETSYRALPTVHSVTLVNHLVNSDRTPR